MSTLDFNSAVINNSDFLMRFARSLTKNQDDADDLLQDTFIKAITNHEKFREGTNLKAWLYTMMRNIFINNYRKAKTRNTFNDPTDNGFFLESAQLAPQHADSDLEVSYIEKVIDSIQYDYRVAFKMYFTGYKYEEIANELEIPLGTVKSRIFLARKELQTRLKEYRQ